MRKVSLWLSGMFSFFVAAGFVGCGPAKSSDAVSPTGSAMVLPNLSIYFSADIPMIDRFDAVDVMREKQDSLNYAVVPMILAIQGFAVPLPSHRRVFVHSGTLLKAPYAYDVPGYVDLTRRGNYYNDIHVTIGGGREVPDFLHQYTHSAYYPYEIWDQQPTYILQGQTLTLWSFVKGEEDVLNRKWKFLRGIP